MMHLLTPEEVKLAFGELEAAKLLKAVKPNVIRKGMTEVGGLGYAGMPAETAIRKGIGSITSALPQLKTQVEGQLEDPMVKGFISKQPHIFTPNRGDAKSFLQQAMPKAPETEALQSSLQQVQPHQRKMLDAVMKGHEQAETQVPQAFGVTQYGHRSPDVILREHNMVSTLPPEHVQVGNVMKDLRGLPGGEADALKPYGIAYGQNRLSRHARKHITGMMHNDQLASIKGQLAEAEKQAFATNAYSGPMNPTFMKMESHLPASKISIAMPSRAGVPGTGHGSEPTRGGFLMASRQEAPIIPMRKQGEAEVFAEFADKPKKILNGDHLQYILDKERGDGVDRGKLKEKDSESADYGVWPYKPGDFKPVDMRPVKLSSVRPELIAAVLRAYDRHMSKTAANPMKVLQQSAKVGKTPNQLGNTGSSVREVALPKMLTTIGTIARAPVAAVDKGGKI